MGPAPTDKCSHRRPAEALNQFTPAGPTCNESLRKRVAGASDDAVTGLAPTRAGLPLGLRPAGEATKLRRRAYLRLRGVTVPQEESGPPGGVLLGTPQRA
jgi:hypothetical protein